MPKYAEVLVNVANRRLDQSYYYVVPENMDLKAGMIVIVPLKNRRVQGLVTRISTELSEISEDVEIRPIEAILEGESLIPEELLELAVWLAETTICPVAQALHTVWPFLKGKAEQWYIPQAGMEDEDVKVLELLDPDTFCVLKVLNRARRGGLPEGVLLKRAKVRPGLLEEMLKQGWVKKELRFTKASSLGTKKSLPPTKENKVSSFLWQESPHQLTAGQAKAWQTIWDCYRKRKEETVLLFGVTGSGKTEIYREMVFQVLKDGGDAIVLVPEISLTSQIARVFLEQFGDLVGIIHSGISLGEKLALWEKILAGEKRIVIGARSAVFAPLPNLRLIILDEEHDTAYKQDENPKYHARDVARYRMKQRQGLVLLGSATPSLEAYAAAQRGIITIASLKERYNNMALPTVQIIDMKKELAKGNKSLFSIVLRQKLRERIQRGEQSILFLNRRGYSTFVFCRECGYVARCPNCDIALTYHSQKQKLCCHYCDYSQDVFDRCPDCGSRFIRFFGQGTEKVEEEVAALFPDVEVLRLDTDTTAGSNKHKEIIERFRRGEVPILVGTQMLAKGLDFPNVTLVGVISADQLLYRPDFRARERAFQLLTQVAGRAGRGVKKGEVIIQTYSPGDRAIIRAASQDYPAFFWEEISYRKQLNYPPFAHILRVILFQEKEEKVIRAANDLADCLKRTIEGREEEDYQILGPAPAVITKLKNQYRWQVSVKGKNPDILRQIVHSAVKAFFQGISSSGINLSIEVNPLAN
ncbi:MAG TPA: primosomal protein N' [Peptococcaceae bacterium]|nr:primosomal protein N' [Peptococcaceae bacterium]